jgi:glucosyl-3-phosphoglycerate synthase
MGDFYQGNLITTIHRLTRGNIDDLESTLRRAVNVNPVALVIPALHSDLQGDAAQKILAELAGVTYLREIVISLGRASEDDFREARRMVAGLPQDVHIVWNDGPRVQALYRLLGEHGLTKMEDGKGRSAWISYGLVLALGNSKVIALHDSDIVTYDREMLARLVFPVVMPAFSYAFCKGFYSRVSEGRLKGRVTRLFVFPLVKALRKILGQIPFLEFLNDFRYPLAGEFSMDADLARVNRIPSDWGLEVGVLSEVHRNVSPRRVCQVELCDNYDHKHQVLDFDHLGQGLLKMSGDIAKSLFRTLAADGVVMNEAFFKTLAAAYTRYAEDIIKNYHADALIDSLSFDRHTEEASVEAFCGSLRAASEEFFHDPMGVPLIPNWSRVEAAIPDFLDQLVVAVREDSREG